MDILNTIPLEQLWNKLQQEKNVAILCHKNTDGDCFCSAFALQQILTSFNTWFLPKDLDK